MFDFQSFSRRRPRARHDWYRIQAADDATEIFIYDEIGFFGIGADQFVRDLQDITTDELSVRLNTPGGDVFDGLAIYNALRRHPAHVTTHIDGLAASIGSVIALAGDRIVMADNAQLMIHEPWTLTIGNSDDLRKQADVLDQINDTLVGIYVARTGADESEIRALMRDETWFTASEADAFGFVDEVTDTSPVEARFDLSHFRNAPTICEGEPTKRDCERALRDAGFSRAKARAFVSRAYDSPTAGQACPQREADAAERLYQLLTK